MSKRQVAQQIAYIRLSHQRRMRAIWNNNRRRKKLSRMYHEAIEAYLSQNAIKKPKIPSIYTEPKRSIRLTESQHRRLQNIAYSRKQDIAIIIDEALSEFLDKIDNYLGAGFERALKNEIRRMNNARNNSDD